MSLINRLSRPNITVIGSINMDLVTVTNKMPDGGETVHGEQFATLCGGKGANQAVACARLGANVTFIGAVGNDAFGEIMVNNLKQEGVHTELIAVRDDVASGTATIVVADNDNRIIVVPGANGKVSAAQVQEHADIIRQSDLVLLQLETPLPTVEAAVELAYDAGKLIILNPAPAVKLPASLLDKVSYVTPNEHELAILLGNPASVHTVGSASPDVVEADVKAALLQHLPGRVVMTKGAEGAYWTDSTGSVQRTASHSVQAVDTTGAGDTFNGALAVKLAQGFALQEAISWAVAAGALSVTKFGAQSGMPTDDELESFMAQL
ncbi:ribokinase [Paenibacillus sp. 481]|uniref:ribokinase n=1 Tax=Paenibacillus sp. 481 TaxID=2835869 RepID=UPI001E44C295|nr:ribokinase [Paenibacillus sp. 481]UHA72822.1 ribokinase [Paenibacillus sp. 481]